jgi:hypothetical protein
VLTSLLNLKKLYARKKESDFGGMVESSYMTTLLPKIERIENAIKSFSNFDSEKRIKRIHVENRFNKNHSIVLSSFEDLKVLSRRLEETTKKWVDQETRVQQMPSFKNTKSGAYPYDVQIELKKSDRLGAEVRVDFKALYIFSKILLDQYVKFLYFINPAEGVRSGSIASFLNSIEDASSKIHFYEKLIIELKDTSTHVLEKLVFYRDKKIEHSQLLNEDVWFTNDMRGGITISHVDRNGGVEVSTMKPDELVDLAAVFFTITSNYYTLNRGDIS